MTAAVNRRVNSIVEDEDDELFNMCSQDLAKVDDLCVAACSGDTDGDTTGDNGIASNMSMSFPKRRKMGQ